MSVPHFMVVLAYDLEGIIVCSDSMRKCRRLMDGVESELIVLEEIMGGYLSFRSDSVTVERRWLLSNDSHCCVHWASVWLEQQCGYQCKDLCRDWSQKCHAERVRSWCCTRSIADTGLHVAAKHRHVTVSDIGYSRCLGSSFKRVASELQIVYGKTGTHCRLHFVYSYESSGNESLSRC